MELFLSIIGKIFDFVLWPFRTLHPFFGLFFVALITGFMAVAIFKYVSDQKALKEIMNRIKLHFAEIILYRDDFRQILLAQKEILKHNIRYFIRTIKPAIPIVAIVLITLSQMNIRYSFRPVSPGEPLTVKITMADNSGGKNAQDVELILPEGFKMVTPAFHIAESSSVEWRIRGKRTGEFDLGFRIGFTNTFSKKILIGPPARPFSPHLGKQGFVEKVLNPLEDLLPREGFIEAIDLGYLPRSFNLGVFDWTIHWLWAFLVIAIAFGLVCRKVLKVS